GIGRLRRAIEKLGLAARKISFATGQPIPDDCGAVIDTNPRTRYSPGETELMRRYLERGGSAMFLIEPDYELDDSLAALLASAGVRVGMGVIVDPKEHYFTDEQMVAVSHYGAHPITRGLALSFYPGARPLEIVQKAGIRLTPLVASSAEAYVIADRLGNNSTPSSYSRGSRVIAVAAEGKLNDAATLPFRMVVA